MHCTLLTTNRSQLKSHFACLACLYLKSTWFQIKLPFKISRSNFLKTCVAFKWCVNTVSARLVFFYYIYSFEFVHILQLIIFVFFMLNILVCSQGMLGLEYFVANFTIIAWGFYMWCFNMLHNIVLPVWGSAAHIALPISTFISAHLGQNQSIKIWEKIIDNILSRYLCKAW